MDALLQVEQLEPKHQIEEVSAVENRSQVQVQQASEITMIADAVYNESQIGLKYPKEMKDNPSSGVQHRMKKPVEVQTKDDGDVGAHVTEWQELKQHDIVQQRQEQEISDFIKKSYTKILAEEDHNFRHETDRA